MAARKAPAKVKPKLPADPDAAMVALMDTFNAKMGQALDIYSEEFQRRVDDYNKLLETQVQRLQDMEARAMEQFAGAVDVKPEPPKPAARWVEAEDERVLVLNQQGVELFNSIFDGIGAVVNELNKRGIS